MSTRCLGQCVCSLYVYSLCQQVWVRVSVAFMHTRCVNRPVSECLCSLYVYSLCQQACVRVSV